MKNSSYIRVGTSYYKLVQLPTISGDFNEILVPWSLETLRHDHGKAYIGRIKKYDGFTCIPSHLDFKQEVFGFYGQFVISGVAGKIKKLESQLSDDVGIPFLRF